MIKKFKLGKDILILTVITLITVLTWVSFEVWLAATQTTITKVTKDQMASLNPKINTQTIESLKGKLTLSAEQIDQLMSSPVATPSSDQESHEQETVPTEESATESGQTATESSQTSTESAINN
jgi:hypothetical protein